MLKKFRAILLEHYIGAIAIGYLIGRGFEAFFASFMPILNIKLTEVVGGRRLIDEALTNARISLISNLILTAFYFFAAFLLAVWLDEK